MISTVDLEQLTPAAQMTGEDDEETQQLRASLEEAKELPEESRLVPRDSKGVFGVGDWRRRERLLVRNHGCGRS